MSSYNIPAATPLATGSSPGATTIARTGALSFGLEIQIAAYRMRQRRLNATIQNLSNGASWNHFNNLLSHGSENAIMAFINSQTSESLSEQRRPGDSKPFEANMEERASTMQALSPKRFEVVPVPEPLMSSPIFEQQQVAEQQRNSIALLQNGYNSASWNYLNQLLASNNEDAIMAFINSQTPESLARQCRPVNNQLYGEEVRKSTLSPRIVPTQQQDVVSQPEPVVHINQNVKDGQSTVKVVTPRREEKAVSPQEQLRTPTVPSPEKERLSGLSTAPVPSPNGTPLLVAGIKRQHGDDEELQIMPKKSRNELVASHSVSVPQRMRLAVEFERQEAEHLTDSSSASVPSPKAAPLSVAGIKRRHGDDNEPPIMPKKSRNESVASPSVTVPQRMRLVVELERQEAERLADANAFPVLSPMRTSLPRANIKRRHNDEEEAQVVPKKLRRAVLEPRPRLPRIAKTEAAAKAHKIPVKQNLHRVRKNIRKPIRPSNMRKNKKKTQQTRGRPEAEVTTDCLSNARLPPPSPVTVNQRWTVHSAALTPADVKTVVKGAGFEAALYTTGVVALCGHFEGVEVAASETLIAAAKKLPRIIYNDPADKIVQITAGKHHLVFRSKKGQIFTLGQATEGQLGANSCPRRYRQLEPSPSNMRRVVLVTEKVTSAKTGRARNVKKAVTFTDIGATDVATIGWTAQGKAYRCGTVGAWKSPLLVPCPELDRQ